MLNRQRIPFIKVSKHFILHIVFFSYMIEDSNGVSHEFMLESEKYIGIKSEKEFFNNKKRCSSVIS